MNNAPRTLWVVVDKDGDGRAWRTEQMAGTAAEWDADYPSLAPHRVIAYSPQGASVPRELRRLLHQIDDVTTVRGYGFYRPHDPHDFHPDAESSTEVEIAAHKAACEAFGKPDYVPPLGSEWVGDGDTKIHILRAPWGIGSYSEQDPEVRKLLDAAFALLDAAPREPVKDEK